MDVSVNSTIIQVSSRKKGSPLLCWQSPIDGKDDLLDLLISRIQAPQSLFIRQLASKEILDFRNIRQWEFLAINNHLRILAKKV